VIEGYADRDTNGCVSDLTELVGCKDGIVVEGLCTGDAGGDALVMGKSSPCGGTDGGRAVHAEPCLGCTGEARKARMGTRSNDDGAGPSRDVGGVCGVLSAVAKGKQFSSKTT
jgi:hypothetical protein